MGLVLDMPAGVLHWLDLRAIVSTATEAFLLAEIMADPLWTTTALSGKDFLRTAFASGVASLGVALRVIKGVPVRVQFRKGN